MNKQLPPNPGYMYEIRLEGCLTDGWTEWFGGLSIQAEDDSTTVLRGFLLDQAALFGILNKIHALNLSLLSVIRYSPKDETYR
jgi:hypothetical protein